jgi:hypothetical protein
VRYKWASVRSERTGEGTMVESAHAVGFRGRVPQSTPAPPQGCVARNRLGRPQPFRADGGPPWARLLRSRLGSRFQPLLG